MNVTTGAILVISSLSLVASALTLGIVLVGGKKAQMEIAELKAKTNGTLSKVRAALEDLEV